VRATSELATTKGARELEMDLLRFATAGSVDAGKSTLIGRLLYDSKQVFEDQLAAIQRTSARAGRGYVDLALLTDGLRAEREQGITIDVAYRYFATPRRKFIVADTPGHFQYTRNMVTGASTADLALILIDARAGIVEQSRRHAFIAALLGVRRFAVCINKLDLFSYDEGRFNELRDEFDAFVAELPGPSVDYIPLSALHGANVVRPSPAMSWYDGPALLPYLEEVETSSSDADGPLRFPIQLASRQGTPELGEQRVYSGRVERGRLRRGSQVSLLPSGQSSAIASISLLAQSLTEAAPPLAVKVTLADDLDVSRGDMLVSEDDPPRADQTIEAAVCWMTERPLEPGGRYLIKHTTRYVRADCAEVVSRFDVNVPSAHLSGTELGLNDLGIVRFETLSPIFFDSYHENRNTGSFIVIDETTNDTVGAGMIR
jgi:sulfate adenylyltransferase large subunit